MFENSVGVQHPKFKKMQKLKDIVILMYIFSQKTQAAIHAIEDLYNGFEIQ